MLAGRRLILGGVAAVALAAGAGCSPSGVADRVSLATDGSGGAPGSGGTGAGGVMASGGAGGAGGGGAGGQGGVSATGGMPGSGGGSGGMATGGAGGGGGSGPPDLAGPDLDEPDEPIQAPPDVAPPGKALVVVGDPQMLSNGDRRLAMLVAARGFTVTYADDNAGPAGATGQDLVVLASSSVSGTLAAKYKDVTVPVLDLEASVLDDMKMTGPTKATDYDEDDETRITIMAGKSGLPLAAGKSGTVTVTMNAPTGCCGINWGKPASSAITVATFGAGASDRITIFAYDKGAAMVDGFVAPGRRVGLFAADSTVEHLGPDGVALLHAAIDWLTP